MNDTLLKPKDVKAILNCSNKKVYELFHEIGFPVIRIGKLYYVRESEFNKWINRKQFKL